MEPFLKISHTLYKLGMQENALSSAEKGVDVGLRERDLAFLFEETRKVGRIESFPHALRTWNARKYFWM